MIFRHTSVDVLPGVVYGDTDVPLAASFPAEAEKVKAKMADFKPDIIFCSPLQRCRLLAQHLFPFGEIEFDARLKELNFGDWEEKTWDAVYQEKAGRFWFDNYASAQCPGGEAFPDLMHRVRHFMRDRLSVADGKKVAVVTHGGPYRIVRGLLNNASAEAILASENPTYGAVEKIDFPEGKNF